MVPNVVYPAGDSTCGQRALYQSGMTGIPIYNVNNNCATGSSALHLAYQFVRGGSSDCALALGFEKMEKGSLGSKVRELHFAFVNSYLIHGCQSLSTTTGRIPSTNTRNSWLK